MRLHRYIAQCGITSRRKAEDMIREGRVMVNGSLVTEMGVTVDPEQDEIEIDGSKLQIPRAQYFLFNKPKGVVTTMSDPEGRRTVADFFPDSAIGIKPVGRLDYNTEGLMILTNDGELTARLTHPKWGVEKEYEAVIEGVPTQKTMDRLQKGIWIEGGKTAPARATIISQNEEKRQSKVVLTIHEGRKHQVRLMFDVVGHRVINLKRVRIGPFLLTGMKLGEMRKIGHKEVQALKKSLGMSAES